MRTLTKIMAVAIPATVLFNVPYSRTRKEFSSLADKLIEGQKRQAGSFTEEEINTLPRPLQRYFKTSGFLGKPKMSHMKAAFENVEFYMGKERRLKIDYTQYNAADRPDRIAYIDSSLYGIPFEGLDVCIDGKGSMKGTLGKLIRLFDQRGEAMDCACLVTYLAECLLVPSVILKDFIVWEEVNDRQVKAVLTWGEIRVEGVFTFNELDEMVSFTTNDREAVSPDGTSQRIPWTAYTKDYTWVNGFRLPTTLQAVWHYEDGDFLYFDGRQARIEYGN